MNHITAKWCTSAQGSKTQSHCLRDELRKKLLDYDFTHFITLASNHQLLGADHMRNLLRAWDACVNREINGPRWAKRPDERLLWFAFLENFGTNPHWHLIAQVDPVIKNPLRAERTRRLPEIAKKHWLKLLPRGSFDCQGVESKSVCGYVTKMIADELYFETFVIHSEFMNI